MKPNRFLVPAGLMLFLALCLVPVAQAQQATPTPVNQAAGVPWQLGLSWTFTATSTSTSAIPVKGLTYWRLLYVPSGTVSSCSLSFDSSALGVSYSTGGIVSAGTIGSCAAASMFVTTSATVPTNFGQLTPTITGSGSVTVVLFGYTDNPAAGGSIGGSVAVTNFPATQPVSGSGNFSTQPAGFGSVLSNQQAVTASAVALASNAVHGACVKALPANTIDVYVGQSGVTTSTGYDLAPGDWACYQVSNTNLLFVIASTTGASVSWTAN